MLKNKFSYIGVLAFSFLIGLAGAVFASGVGSNELDGSGFFSVSTSSPAYVTVQTVAANGVGSNELDVAEIDNTHSNAGGTTGSPMFDDRNSDNDGIRVICASTLGSTSEEHAADYCHSLYGS